MGRIEDADRYVTIAREISAEDDIDAQAKVLMATARILAVRGEGQAAEATARRAVDVIGGTAFS